MKDKLETAIANAEEVVTVDEVKEILAGPSFNFYYGTAPTGPFHFAYLIPLNKLVELSEMGGEGTILLADYHAHLDDQKTSFELMELRSKYYEECIRGVLGEHARKFKFLRGSTYQHRRDYVEDLYKIAAKVTTNRAKRASSEVVRQRGEAKVSELLYPLLQILDVKYLQADLTVSGIDQRNIYMLGRETLESVDYKKGSYIFMPLLPSLKGGGAKMSASDPLSHIRVTDSPASIKKTIKKAYCPAGDLEQNPITSTMRYIVFPRYNKILIERKEKFGGDLEFNTIDEFEKAYKAEEIHPMDVKNSVTEYLIELLTPARKYFENNPEILEEIEKTFEK
ncbi:MAG: Tyrosine--tRNA ligase [Candidatus Thorarchaeota archaeon]|nr:MAG: Tyrosine--tRNA ligase [Candidatus Thorarchaeota archaeon]